MASDLAASDLVSKCTTTDTGLEVTLAKNVSVVTRVGGDGNMLLTLSSGAAAATAPAATGNGSVLHVNVASVNIKKIDLKVYGIDRPMCQVVLIVEGVEMRTKELFGLDPIWEEDFHFNVSDPATVKVEAKFMCAGQQLGDTQTYPLNTLIKGKPTFKGIFVPGGKVDMMFTATNFGDEAEAEADDSFMDFL